MSKNNIFISYSRRDFDEVKELYNTIKSRIKGINIWFDITGIESGDEFDEKIINAIDNSEIVLFALSDNSINSKWTKDEVMYAKNTGKRVVPVLLKGGQLKGWFLFNFGRIDCIDLSNELQRNKMYANFCQWFGLHQDNNSFIENTEKQVGNQIQSPIPQGSPCSPIHFVHVEGGVFEMGATIEQGKDAFESEKPYHTVRLSSFLISETPITVSQYRDYCKASGKEMPPAPSWGWIENHPIVNVSWFDASQFASFYGCRLPNEAQWEYAARGGNMTKHYKYAGGNSPSLIGWFADNTYQMSTAPVKTKLPNELGLFDMSGNVYEWCSNWKYDYSKEGPNDPEGPSEGVIKSSRGGSWHSSSRSLRVTNRDDDPPEFFSHNVGFRVIKEI